MTDTSSLKRLLFRRGLLAALASALCLGAGALAAQEVDPIGQLQQQIHALQRQLDEMKRKQAEGEAAQRQMREQMEKVTAEAASKPAPAVAAPVWQAGDPLRGGRGKSYLDLSFDALFAVGGSTERNVAGLQSGGHDPSQRGFTVQNLETVFSGVVDPYFRGQANLVYSLTPEGESVLEVEEAFAETLSLPGNLQLRAGQFLTEFGRHNATHPHAWGFVDAPLVNARLLGPDGLRNPGARLAWLMPTPFYSELSLAVQNSGGETAAGFRSGGGHAHSGVLEGLPLAFRHADNDRGVRGVGDMLFAPRYAASFDLSDTQTLLAGVSAAFGPNASGAAGDTSTRIYGADLFWKWKPVNHAGGFPFVAFQTEALLRRYKAGTFDWSEEGAATDPGVLVDAATGAPALLAAETLTDYGFYAQLQYGFRRGWVAGLRGDYVAGDRAGYEKLNLTLDGQTVGSDPLRAGRWRLSPNLTWYPSEFSKVRLQYNYDDYEGLGTAHAVWLQLEFLLGTHGAHKF